MDTLAFEKTALLTTSFSLSSGFFTGAFRGGFVPDPFFVSFLVADAFAVTVTDTRFGRFVVAARFAML